MRLITLASLICLLTACANGNGYYTQDVNSWRGKDAHQLLKAWGEPYMTTSNGSSTTYTYQESGLLNNNVTYSPSVGVVPRSEGAAIVTEPPTINADINRTKVIYCTTVFTANSQGKIIHTSVSGSRCHLN